jgi:Chitin binding Peritrophin-A domain
MNKFILDPKYCHIYHLCGIGRHQVLKCAENLWYSPDREECEWPERANCNYFLFIEIFHLIFIGKAGHLYTSSTATTNMVDGDGNIVTTPRHFRPNNVYLPIECPRGVQDHFPDPYDCSAFHYCNGMLNNNINFIIE